MKRKYDSELLQVLHEEMMDFHRSGFISDERMREIDEKCFGEEDETGPEAETETETENPQNKEPATA